jgi:UDP-N-acetylmuramyl tripeptide synthase
VGISREVILKSFENFDLAFGRGEIIETPTNVFQVFLAKNPASFNQNLNLFSDGDFSESAFLFVLNDNIPDGRDVSWIYDIEPLKLREVCFGKQIYVSGKRYLDMAIRLKYAGVDVIESNICENLQVAISKIQSKNVVVLPNYSAMLAFRKLTLGREIL